MFFKGHDTKRPDKRHPALSSNSHALHVERNSNCLKSVLLPKHRQFIERYEQAITEDDLHPLFRTYYLKWALLIVIVGAAGATSHFIATHLGLFMQIAAILDVVSSCAVLFLSGIALEIVDKSILEGREQYIFDTTAERRRLNKLKRKSISYMYPTTSDIQSLERAIDLVELFARLHREDLPTLSRIISVQKNVEKKPFAFSAEEKHKIAKGKRALSQKGPNNIEYSRYLGPAGVDALKQLFTHTQNIRPAGYNPDAQLLSRTPIRPDLKQNKVLRPA